MKSLFHNLSMNKIKKKPDEFTQMTCCLFPEIFSFANSQDNKLAQQIMDKILKLFNVPQKERQFFQSILIKKDIEYIQYKLKSLQNHQYAFISQYGCLIDFYKEQSFSPTELYLIFPIEWSFGSIIKEGECKYIPCNANKATYLFIGAITYGSFSVKKEKQLFIDNLNILIENKIQDRKNLIKGTQKKNHHTPTWLLQVAKQSCKKFNKGEIQDKKAKTKENSSLFQAISKGGTLDVGDHVGTTKPNTSFEIVKDYLFFLIEDQQLINLMIIDFQLHYIIQEIRSFSKLSVLQDKKYRQCMQSLVYKIKQLTNHQISYNESGTRVKIESIYQHLNQSFESKQGQSINLKNLYKTIQMSVNQEGDVKYVFNSIRSYDYYNLQSFKHSGVLGFSYPLKNITNFTQLLSNKYEQSLWIMMVEQFFFYIAETRLGPENIPIDIKLSEIKCNSSNDFSIMHQVINKYETIMKGANKLKIYGLMLQNQTYGHLYLIKYIGAAIAFQVIKRERQNKESNLQDYCIPQNIGKLYSLFSSLSYEARKGITAILNYSTRNKSKRPIFQLDGTNKSFYLYANIIADQDEKIIGWKTKSKTQLSDQIQNLKKEFSNFKNQYEAAKNQKVQTQIGSCLCQQEFIQKHYKLVRVFKKCQRCKDLKNINSRIATLQSQKGRYIIGSYPEHQINLYGFIQCTPLDILGMMKIIYEAQIQVIIPSNSSNQGNFFTQSYSPMIPHTSQVKGGEFALHSYYQRSPQLFVKYPSKITKNIYRDISEKVQISQKLLSQDKLQNPEMELRYQFMINSPEINNSKRQHENYSKLYYKGREENIEEFLAFANIRVSQQTQLMILGEKIKNRELFIKNLISNSNIAQNKNDIQRDKYAKMLIILKAVADINGLRKINSETQEVIRYPIIEECVLDMLENYQRQWRYQDMYFLHIVGIIFSLLAVEINKPEYPVRLAQRAYKQYQKYANQSGVDNLSIKSQLSYFLHGMLSCYTQDITQDMDDKSIQLWAKLMILLRINKVFSDQNLKDTRFRETMIFYDHFRERAVFKNVDNAKNYFIKNVSQLTKIINIVDKDIPCDTEWKHNRAKGQYVFTGVWQKKVYDLNIFTGILLKNNCQVAGLPEIIKQNQKYIAIFDKDRDLQIFSQLDGSLRTRTDFSQFFQNQPNTTVLFQFKILQRDIIIRMIIKRGKDEFKYVLISEDILNDSNFIIPVIYRKEYFAWYCQTEKHIVFRQKKLNKMCKIGLIVLVNIKDNQITVKEGRIIQNKFKKQSLEYLKLIQNSNLFDHIIFFAKNVYESNQLKHPNLGFQILNSIQLPDYIIQIISQTRQKGQNKTIKFWLHRYNLKFTLSQQYGLLSDNYQGYAICQQFNSYQLLPWGTYEKINCLVLQKTQKNMRFAKNHEKLILIPDTKVSLYHQKDIRNQILNGETKQMRMFSYQIHDFLKDLRSKTKLQQLHLACIIASCYVPVFQPLMMTNIEYALQIMRSCLNPVPLSQDESKKLENILKNSISLNQLPLILMSQVIYEASNALKYILPYNNGNVHGRNKQIKVTLFDKNVQYIDNCKDKYFFSLKEETISIRSKLNELELKIINLSKGSRLIHKSYKQSNKWDATNKISFAKNDKIEQSIQYWKNKIKQHVKNITRIIKIEEKEQAKPQVNSQLSFDLNLNKKDKMSQQKNQQIQSSLNSYLIIKQKFDKINISKKDKDNFIKQLEQQSVDIRKIKGQILSQINSIQSINKNHYDFLSGRYTFIKQRDFTQILCNQNHLSLMFPDISDKEVKILKNMIQVWIQFSIFQSSLQRIILILSDKQNLDKVNLLREIESPREQIVKRIPWICFQLEMKTQIWLSQYETFKLLEQNKSGSVTQLNMGEGKTQIIIPMLVLNEIYIKKQFVPRVNILSPLYKQAQDNYFKFFSITGFRINVFPIYFNRTVQINTYNIRKLQYVFNLFKQHSLILIDRDSHLSLILKLRQQKLGRRDIYENEDINYRSCNQKDKWIFRNIPLLDIFDEVDALMTAKKSFVYAIGGSETLPDSRLRFQYNRVLIQIILKEMLDHLIQHQMIVIEQSIELAKLAIREGRFPKGFRFLAKIKEEKIMEFRKILIQFFLTNYIPPEFQFYKQINKSQREDLIKYLSDSSQDSISTIERHKGIPSKVYNQIYAVRGIVAYGVLQHSLSLRCGVDYGVPSKENMKRVGVPYQAADVPSKRSQYSHPEVATILSYFSYFNQGLKFCQFQEAIKTLLNLTQSSQKYNYQLWLNCIEQDDKKPKLIRDTKQINQESIAQKYQLYNCFKFCRNTIVFWLVHCVFPNDLAQFNTSITASSWDIADSVKSLGFSGTKDTHWILPTYLKLLQSQNNQINGTDGKMIKLMIEHTLQVLELEETPQDLWKRFVSTALRLKVGCLIDAGAILAGKSLQNIIVPWISNEARFKQLGYRGISYCDENGRWRVYDTSSHTTIDRQTSIPEHETFVIFDEARTRGADMKMKSDTKAALSLGPNMTKDKLMQAVGRLRKFGRNQQIYILSTKQNYSKIEGFNQQIITVKQKTKKIIEWVCINSINDNKKMMYPNSKLAWIHFQNTNSQNGIITQKFNPSLHEMYKEPIKYETVSNLNDQMANTFKKMYQQNQFTVDLVYSVKYYGRQYMVRCQHLQNICERETQMIEETEKQREKELALLKPMQESKSLSKYIGNLSTIDIKLNDKLFFSNNFKQCTYYGYEKNSQSSNQLCQIHFALIKPNVKEFLIITQREANIMMLNGTQCLGPYSIKQTRNVEFIVRFKDVTINLPIIRQNELERALTDAQFFNGHQNFQKRQLLSDTIKINSVRLKRIELQSLICHFVERRRTIEDKFYCSDLEAVFKQIINSK